MRAYNEFDCPVCDDLVEVPLPYAKYVTCPNQHHLEIMPDAEWFDGMWHDRTTLKPDDDPPRNPETSQPS